jgi:predicted methyltransferase
MSHIVLSYLQAEDLLRARQGGEARAVISPDLGLTTVEVGLGRSRARFPDGQLLTCEDLETISDSPRSCFQVFSGATDRFYSLMPTQGAPTMLVSGIPMHRIKGIDPHQDTLRKIKTIAPIKGHVLDTATGPGIHSDSSGQIR